MGLLILGYIHNKDFQGDIIIAIPNIGIESTLVFRIYYDDLSVNKKKISN